MLKDRFVEASRSPDCAYAIDCKDGGRLLSPLQAPQWINFFQRNRTWTGLKQKFIDLGTGDFTLELKLRRNKDTTFAYLLSAGGASLGLMIAVNPGGGAEVHFRAFLGQAGTWSNLGVSIVGNNTNAYCFIPSTRLDGAPTLKITKNGNSASIYIDNAIIGTYTGLATAITSTSEYGSNFDGNILSASLKNSAGTVVWQAYPADLYETWRPQPVPGSAATGTWEVRNGLLKPSVTATFADGRLTDRFIDTTVDLRGSTGSFSLLWYGSIAKDIAVIHQGLSSMESGIYFYMNIIGMLSMTIGNGTIGVSASAMITEGEHSLTMVVDRTAQTLKGYVDGALAATVTISVNFGAINPNAILTALRLFKGTEAFAFYDRALTAEEVAAI